MIDPAVILAAVVLDLVLGDPRWIAHPVVYMGKLIGLLERVLRRFRIDGIVGGIMLLVCMVAATVVTANALIRSLAVIFPWAGTAAAIFFSYAVLAARSLHQESKLVANALVAGDIEEARRLLSQIVGRDTEQLNEAEIWRALVETVSENTSDGVIAPLLYLMIGGPLLGLAYKAVNTLDSMVGYRNDRYLKFGWASARCDDLFNYVPARLTGVLMVMAAPLVGLSGKAAWKTMLRDGRNHLSPNSGIPEAAAAGALGVQLGGTNLYDGVAVVKPTIGEGRRSLSLQSYRGAVRLMYATEALLVAAWLLVVLCVVS